MTAYDTARRALEAAAGALAAGGRSVPDRRFVQPGGLPAWDCEQLTVTATRPVVPVAAATGRPVRLPGQVELRVELTRPVPDDAMPDQDELEAAAEGLLADAEALAAGLTPAALSGRPGVAVVLGAVETAGPDGGYAAVAMTVLVPL